MKGLLAILGKPKGESAPESDEEEGAEDSSAKMYAKEAFAALKDDDEAGFVSALLALKGCEE